MGINFQLREEAGTMSPGDEEINKVIDAQIIRNMRAHGGSFVQQLSFAAEAADSSNLQRIKDAFPEIWEAYTFDAAQRIRTQR